MHTQYQFLLSKNDGISSVSFHKYGGLNPCIFGDFYYFRRGQEILIGSLRMF